MKVGNLNVTLHRTVRVADGRMPSNLPPSLGHIKPYRVSEYSGKCPKNWDKDGVFVPLHDTEALWMSFTNVDGRPKAVIVGAGGINALTGEKLGTVLEKDNYIVTPPQPWLDGWKSDDGTVYQFVATPYEKGSGKTVAEQLINSESKTGAIGLAVFESKASLGRKTPNTIYANQFGSTLESASISSDSFDDEGSHTMSWGPSTYALSSGMMKSANAETMSTAKAPITASSARTPTRARRMLEGKTARVNFNELGIGKGGKITQKIYPDPYGLHVWQEKPAAITAIYIVDAETFAQITGVTIPAPKTHKEYGGAWYGLKDENYNDVAGSDKFDSLDSVFVGNTSNIKETPQEVVLKQKKAAGKKK